jgi:hypothetical protein
MSHLPVNHHLQPLYRVLAALTGIYVLVFGIVGWLMTADYDLFAQDGLPAVLGLRANRAFAVLSVAAGLVLLAGAFVGRNVARWINLLGGIAFMVVGAAMLTLLETDLNVLGFSVATCTVSFIIGLVLFAAGLYGRTGSRSRARHEEGFRHGRANDTQSHVWNEGGDRILAQRTSAEAADGTTVDSGRHYHDAT